jgi:hypothetical protein
MAWPHDGGHTDAPNMKWFIHGPAEYRHASP